MLIHDDCGLVCFTVVPNAAQKALRQSRLEGTPWRYAGEGGIGMQQGGGRCRGGGLGFGIPQGGASDE